MAINFFVWRNSLNFWSLATNVSLFVCVCVLESCSISNSIANPMHSPMIWHWTQGWRRRCGHLKLKKNSPLLFLPFRNGHSVSYLLSVQAPPSQVGTAGMGTNLWMFPFLELRKDILHLLLGTQFSSVQFSCSVMSDSLRPHESQHTRLPCPSQTPGVYSNSRPSSRWCHPAISSSVIPFSSCLQPLPASWPFPTSQLFSWGGQSIGISASASVLPMNTQDWSPLGWTG